MMARWKLPYPLQQIALFCIITLLIFLRSRNAFLYPTAQCEDGKEMLAFYFNQRDPSAIFRVYAGYISLLPNLIGYLSARLPITLAPYWLAWVPLLIAGAAHTLFALRRFRGVVASDRLRMLICLLLTLVPVGDVLLYSNTAYSSWNLLWLIFLLTYAPLHPSVVINGLQWLLMLLLLASTPLSVLIIPLCVYNLFTRRTVCDWWMNGSLIVAIWIYLALAIVTTSDQIIRFLPSLIEAFRLLVHRVVAESLLGYTVRMAWHQAGYFGLISGIGLMILGSLLIWYSYQLPRLAGARHVQIGVVAYLITACTVMVVLARDASASLWGPLELRYFYLQQKLFWLLLLTVGVVGWARLRQPTYRYLSGFLFAAYLIWFASSNWGVFFSSPASGQQLAAFLEKVSAAIHTPAHASQEFVLPRGCFDIKLQL